MGLFDKKICNLCGKKLGMFSSKTLCEDCEKKRASAMNRPVSVPESAPVQTPTPSENQAAQAASENIAASTAAPEAFAENVSEQANEELKKQEEILKLNEEVLLARQEGDKLKALEVYKKLADLDDKTAYQQILTILMDEKVSKPDCTEEDMQEYLSWAEKSQAAGNDEQRTIQFAKQLFQSRKTLVENATAYEAPAPLPMSKKVPDDSWICKNCGATNKGKFCMNCGCKKPQ